MTIYVFSLLVGYKYSGVDSAQGKRNKFLKKTGHTIKYIFTQKPTDKYVQRYINARIDVEDMLSMHLYLANNNLFGEYKLQDKLSELCQRWGNIDIKKEYGYVHLYKNDKRLATISLKENQDYFWKIDYLENERLILSEYYADRLLYTDYYASVTNDENKMYAKLVRTSFVNDKGINVYDCLYDDNGEELYVYPNGYTCTKSQFIREFIIKLNLEKEDVIFIDRPSYMDYVQPIFELAHESKIMVFLHSGHYFEMGEEPTALYMNYEYNYWFKYSDRIDAFIVSTEEQKRDLQNKLVEYQCVVPRIEAIEISGLSELKYPTQNRKRNSMLTVSRLEPRKKVGWIIMSVIDAHKYNSEIELDIYGEGTIEEESYLKNLVKSNEAEGYIRFMGHRNMADVYQNYEVYITASLWETLGLSVMEAIGAGNAVIGLNVRYGNRLFIKNDENGKLINFEVENYDNQEKINIMIKELSEAILTLFNDESKLQEYCKCSYKIAEQFLDEKIERKWLELFKTI